MDGYQRRTEKKKQNIRKVALALFAAHGIDKVSLAEIAKKANVSPVSIYNYFGTKDDLVRKTITFYLEETWAGRIQLIQSDLPFPEKIENLFLETSDIVTTVHQDFISTLINDPAIKKIGEDIYYRYAPEFVRFIEQGRADGYIGPDVSAETIMYYFEMLKELKSTPTFKEVSTKPPVMKEIAKLFFYGLLNKKES